MTYLLDANDADILIAATAITLIKGTRENLQQAKIMNIQLKPEDEQFIQIQISRGKYENASEVISKALKLLDEWEKGYQNWVEETRQKVEIAVEQLDRGEGIDGEVVVERLRDKLRKARENQG